MKTSSKDHKLDLDAANKFLKDFPQTYPRGYDHTMWMRESERFLKDAVEELKEIRNLPGQQKECCCSPFQRRFKESKYGKYSNLHINNLVIRL